MRAKTTKHENDCSITTATKEGKTGRQTDRQGRLGTYRLLIAALCLLELAGQLRVPRLKFSPQLRLLLRRGGRLLLGVYQPHTRPHPRVNHSHRGQNRDKTV